MSASSSERLSRLLATARTNPEFAAQLMPKLPEELRSAVLLELARPGRDVKPLGLRKCKSETDSAASAPTTRRELPSYGAHSGFSAQLNLFARSTSRVA